MATGEYELVLGGRFTGGATCRAEMQIEKGAHSYWTSLVPIAASSSELHFRFTVATPFDRLRYRLELDTGGAGTGPTVRSIELRTPE